MDWVRKQPKYDNRFEELFKVGSLVLSEHPHDDSYLFSSGPDVFLPSNPQYKQITFQEFEKHVLKQEPAKQEPMKKYKHYIIEAEKILRIRSIACSTWKDNFTKYLQRIDFHNNVTFTEEEIDAMFAAATDEQRPVLAEIFGEPTKAVEWNRIKTGSKVMIEYTGQHCGGFEGIDLSQPVDVVFFRTPHFINDYAVFKTNSCHSSYCTFHQNGKYVLFSSEKNVDYITEVVEY